MYHIVVREGSREKGAAIGDSALREDTRMPAELTYRAYQDSSRGVTVWGQIEINNKNQTCNVTNAKAQRKTEAETNTERERDEEWGRKRERQRDKGETGR